MLTIKDFKTNDPAVILTMNHGRNEDPVISEVKIGSVGRKYVMNSLWTGKEYIQKKT